MKPWRLAEALLRNNERVALVVILFIGLVIRLYLATLAYPYPVFDMDRYVTLAREILNGTMVAECCDKTAGYPLFLALIFGLFGDNNYYAVRVVQVLIELVTIMCLYKAARDTFGKSAAYFSSVLYAINPFTSSYVGLLLSEVVTLCGIAILMVLVSRKNFPKQPLLWFLYGFTIGALIFIRQHFVVVAFASTFLMAFFVVGGFFRRITFLVLVFTGLILASSYSLYANFQKYRMLSIVPPYEYTGQIYLTFFQTKPFPELLLMGQVVDPIYYEMGESWHRAPLSEREAVNKRYQQLFLQKLVTDWPLFLRNYARNMVWIWDRDHLFYYDDPWYPTNTFFVRLINWMYLSLFLIGFVMWSGIRKKQSFTHAIFFMTLTQISATTFFYTLVSNEVRHSLTSMGVLSLWGGYGMSIVGKLIFRPRFLATP